MKLHDIENLTHAELKAGRTELIEEAKTAPHDDLAARYVQARLDSKARDETMSVQGRTIEELGRAVASVTADRDATKAKLDNAISALASASNSADEAGKSYQATIADLNTKLSAASSRANAAESKAAARRAALADVMTFAGELNARVAPLLAAE